MQSIKEKKQEAKAYRKITSRSALGQWEVQTKRPFVEELLMGQERTRRKVLLPLRRERMSVSPFTFFRGSAILQAHDLASMPGTEFRVQACGDAHISNFGIFASPERRMVFDINDFDETLPAPFEVDIKRLVASIEICGRSRGFSKEQRQAAVFDAAALYRKTMQEFSKMGNMEVWYRHLDLERFLETGGTGLASKSQMQLMANTVRKAFSKNNERAVQKLTETVDGKLRIKSNPPLVVPLRDLVGPEKALYDFQGNIRQALTVYEQSLPRERRGLVEQYEPIELAHKVVGVGSVGRRAWILVLMGREDGDPLVLQIKEAEPSVLEPYYGASEFRRCGHRVVAGQKAIQTAGDILLGYLRLELPSGTQDYYVRQLWDAKGSFDLETIPLEGYNGLSLLCAWTLAHAHAKTGDRHAISGYLGKSEAFENAMASYAFAYADQNEADYEVFLASMKNT